MRYILVLGVFSATTLTYAKDVVCPAGKSNSQVAVEAGDTIGYQTQAGATYEKNTNCVTKFTLDNSCKKIKFSCDSFNLGKGDLMIVKIGKKSKKFKGKKFKKPIVSTKTTLITFKSNKKKEGPGALCSMECIKSAATAAPTPPPTTGPSPPNASETQQKIMDDIVAVWRQYRDPENGFWCDSLWFSSGTQTPCGAQNNFYSSAGTGMGLVTEAIMVELGYQTREEAELRLIQTMTSLLTLWPRETFTGFLVHFTNRNLESLSEFSTIDTSECVLGALFAGNYFGGEVLNLALQLKDATEWSAAIEAADNSQIYPIVDPNTGVFSGAIRPYNEYYLVAYIANMTSEPGSKSNIYFETYYGSSGGPLNGVGDGDHPMFKTYQGYELLTDQPGIFMSSFIPQFNAYLTKNIWKDQYYMDLNTRWLKADKLFWELTLDDSSNIWGIPVKNIAWGAGAGPAPSGYSVERIEGSNDLIISAAIMAGFLPFADTEELRKEINDQLETMYTNDICSYKVTLPDTSQPKILWRCSIRLPEWRCPSVDSIDFSTMILGYSTNFLPADFYQTYAA